MRILICLLFSIVAVDFVTAGCDINLRVKNETKYAIEFSKASPTRSKSFQVKTRGVPWRNVDKGGWAGFHSGTTSSITFKGRGMYEVLESGKTTLDTYDAVLGCGVKRRYRIDFECYEIGIRPEPPEVLVFTGGSQLGTTPISTKTRYFPGPKQWTEGRNVTIPIKSCK